MTFVAQPYEQFADDLLTALTGGMIREEHRFVGVEEPYSLASPGAIPLSIKLFGQYNEAFMLFEGGRDYLYDTTDEAIGWLPAGRQPDDHTFFYVNYYVKEGRRRLTDRNPGSVTATLSAAFAREFAVLHKQMDMIYKSAFIDLATNNSLDHVAALLGLTRKDAKFANGEVLFKRSSPATGDITIPAGTLVSTDQGQNFETADKRTLRRGQLSIAVPIRAQAEGPPGRVDAKTIKNINRPIFGIESVINEEATYFATDKETDDAFRRRIKGTLERAGKATVNAIKYGLIEEVSEITEGNIQVTERADVPGLVEIKLGLETTGDEDWIRQVEEAIFNARPAGVKVVHNLPTRTPSPSQQKAEVQAEMNGARPKSRSVSLPADVLAQMPEGILRLRAEVSLHLVEQNLSAAQKEGIEDEVRQQVVNYIESLPMGADLVFNKLLGNIIQIEEISDAHLFVDADSAAKPSYAENIATDGRKAIIAPQSVTVGLMEEIVHIRISVKLEPKAGQSGTKMNELQSVDEFIRDAINTELAKASAALTRETLQRVIQAQVDKEGTFQMVRSGAVALNAEYEETGRLLNNTETVDLAANQVARLQNLNVNIQGDLDAQI